MLAAHGLILQTDGLAVGPTRDPWANTTMAWVPHGLKPLSESWLIYR